MNLLFSNWDFWFPKWQDWDSFPKLDFWTFKLNVNFPEKFSKWDFWFLKSRLISSKKGLSQNDFQKGSLDFSNGHSRDWKKNYFHHEFLKNQMNFKFPEPSFLFNKVCTSLKTQWLWFKFSFVPFPSITSFSILHLKATCKKNPNVKLLSLTK